ncbi:MAG: 50S ribosomal protein L23 [Candidatus Portnoybacteria bacterium RBG_13_41_18]|uniref:Large ribosomal subunit protein uL23 n=1 Tax=Candidatus Portnoybacteria bacterium RBG_13_41_18 TaxID=1801991 RepID=A0A1G2F843_9BACT|nr:MAG: 50S ribosomal protein L23 [Candidatus Portnoybacteria bacterium RBG_13_41_18]
MLKSPHVTEKSGLLAGQNSYVFKVGPSANKHEIKQAVQNLYGVSVEKVAVINIPKKARRVGKSQGFKAGFRKAMVKLARGEKIEIMPR